MIKYLKQKEFFTTLLFPIDENTNVEGGGRLQPVDLAGAGTDLPMKFWLRNIFCPYRKMNQP